MKYIRGVRDVPLILSDNVSGVLKWWIDASYTVHLKMLGHIGACLSMGRGFLIMNSNKHKLNTVS